MGSIVDYVDQQQFGLSNSMPPYMVLPNTLGALQEKGQYPRPGEHAGWMGPRYNPLTTQVPKRNLEDNPYWRNCVDEELTFQIAGMARPDGVSLDRLDRRRSLLQQFDSSRQSLEQFNGEGYDPFREKAFSLMTSERTRQALDIRRESAELRDRYGRHLFGQSTLMARRLVEAGVRYVTVHYDCVDGYSWDSHRNSDDVKKNLLPTFDQACSLPQEKWAVRPKPTPNGDAITGALCFRRSLQAEVSRAEKSTANPIRTPLIRSIRPSVRKTWQPRSIIRWESIRNCESPIPKAGPFLSSKVATQ